MIQVATEGIKSVVSAMLILSMATTASTPSPRRWVPPATSSASPRAGVTPVTLLALAFAVCAIAALLSTGTSWGVMRRIMIPIVMPPAFRYDRR
ncbi:MAG: hypothetical protein ACLU38_01155 [Dysosmobacter sp.]